MYRKPGFWVVLSLASAVCIFVALKYFGTAFPIINLDIQMDRKRALESGSELAKKSDWGPEDFKQAASFRSDEKAQVFVELEAGGSEAFNRVMAEHLYEFYTWRIRHFKENETNETLILFTPQGQPYGFVEKLPEEEPGTNVSAKEARSLAMKTSRDIWRIDPDAYELVEQAEKVNAGGRVDHTLIYERKGKEIGEGRYRLKLVIGGNKLTELTHFIKIPEGFTRRYQEMRSANKMVASISNVVVYVVYIFVGCVIGLFLLLRRNRVSWRKPLVWGLLIAFLQVLVIANQWPLGWMQYDTALSSQVFVLQRILRLLITFALHGVLLVVTFMAAESLSRKAFPHHIQMWRLWSPGVANSKSVLGRTVAGYLYAGCQLGFVIVFYIFATRFLGWWTPTGHLAQPDILATYLPWLSSFSISLHAGFWEECLFRAVPIAGAALVGQRFGYRRAWIAAALIGQALVFGGAHATYPSQPAYARLVELLVPSLIWGAIFLRFGLLPAIISHFTYDVVLIGLPLFVSSAPGVLFDQTVVVVLTLIPLWVVVFSRWRVGAWSEVKAEAYNLGWIPPVKEKVLAAKEVVTAVGIGKKTRWALALSGIAGLALWVYFVSFQVYAPPLRIDRGRAEAIARETLDRRGIDLPDSWRVLSRVRTPHNHDDRFIWQKGGKEIYAELMGGHLWPPYWFVRFVQFEGDVAQRAEEYNVYIDGRGTPILFEHKVPEAKAGASLDRDEARTLAHAVLKDEFHLNPASLREISVEPSKLPARRDWEFVYSDEANYPLEEGKALITISIAGDEVTEALRSIHTPEEWIRQERSRRNILDALRKSSIGIQVLIFLAGIVGAVVYWSRNKEFHVSAFLPVFSLLLGIRLLVLANNWPVRLSQFSTSEPLFNQAFSSLVFPVVGAVVLSAAIALLISFLQDWKSQEVRIGSFEALWQGFSLGGVVLAVFALIPAFSPSLSPRWGNFKAAGCYLPIVNEVLILLNEYILFCTMILLVFVALDRFSNGWTQRRVWLAPVLIVVGLALLGSRVDSLPAWFVGGPLVGILMLLAYRFVFRFHMALIPLAVAMISIFESGLKKGMHNVHSTALPGNVLAVMLVAALSFYWFGKLVGRRPRE